MEKQTKNWFGIGLPWIIVIVFLAVFCIQAYYDGLNFVPGLHRFKWLISVFIGAFIYIFSTIIAAVIIYENWHILKEQKRSIAAVFFVSTSVIIPLIAMKTISICFYSGRDAAYRRLNYPLIYEACQKLGQDVRRTGKEFSCVQSEYCLNNCLPAVIVQLSPIFVHATNSAVIIQMDGGGSMYHEGIGVILSDKNTLSPILIKECKRLDPSLPIYLYRLYDSSIFFDQLRSPN